MLVRLKARKSPHVRSPVSGILRIDAPTNSPIIRCNSLMWGAYITNPVALTARSPVSAAFSKKWENLRAMLAVYFAFYNFCRIHSSIRCTPAMESGLTNKVWTLRDLLEA